MCYVRCVSRVLCAVYGDEGDDDDGHDDDGDDEADDDNADDDDGGSVYDDVDDEDGDGPFWQGALLGRIGALLGLSWAILGALGRNFGPS